MTHPFVDLLETLNQGANAIGRNLERALDAKTVDLAALMRIEDAARNFADQADSLAALLEEPAGDERLLGEAEQLAIFFRSVEQRLEFVLGNAWV